MRRRYKKRELMVRIYMIVLGIIFIILSMSAMTVYMNKQRGVDDSIINGEQIGSLDETIDEYQDDDSEYVSLDIGKSVNEVSNEISNDVNTLIVELQKSESDDSNNIISKENGTQDKEKKEEINEDNEEEKENVEINFTAPIKGEIIKEFAPDSLVYSETLEEWVTHKGIDIKADKTSVVANCAKGIVKSIKNDPRYGLTVIVEHDGGYKTLYANLLTAEFVVEGEEIEEGQTIGTIGNSANFEINEDYHLHFELIKDGEYLNPSNFMNF